ncbi:MAG: DUF3276 family protein [Treponema sp.]|nr:DUF3276 family protein [Treponema sp.]MCL2252052.1 DUF3276 family protein [Treponema sp.]
MGVRGEIFSSTVSLPNRTYFFNVKENRMGDLYLNIVESKNRDNGGFERQSVILFAEDLQEFLKGFDESLKVLEKAVREKRTAKPKYVKREEEQGDRTDNEEQRSEIRESGKGKREGRERSLSRGRPSGGERGRSFSRENSGERGRPSGGARSGERSRPSGGSRERTERSGGRDRGKPFRDGERSRSSGGARDGERGRSSSGARDGERGRSSSGERSRSSGGGRSGGRGRPSSGTSNAVSRTERGGRSQRGESYNKPDKGKRVVVKKRRED